MPPLEITLILTLTVTTVQCFCTALYWRRQFRKAQSAAESLFYLAADGATSYDNGVWHEGICEGEVIAGRVLEETRQVLMRLPGADEYFTDMCQDELPF